MLKYHVCAQCAALCEPLNCSTFFVPASHFKLLHPSGKKNQVSGTAIPVLLNKQLTPCLPFQISILLSYTWEIQKFHVSAIELRFCFILRFTYIGKFNLKQYFHVWNTSMCLPAALEAKLFAYENLIEILYFQMWISVLFFYLF